MEMMMMMMMMVSDGDAADSDDGGDGGDDDGGGGDSCQQRYSMRCGAHVAAIAACEERHNMTSKIRGDVRTPDLHTES